MHPYHPLRGQQFPVLKMRRVSGVDTLILRGAGGETFAVPLAWTDAVDFLKLLDFGIVRAPSGAGHTGSWPSYRSNWQ